MSSLAADLLARLRQRGWKLAIAESLTGGEVASSLVAVPGASESLLGAVVAYSTAIKHSVLGVDADLLATYGPVHREVAAQMAAGVRTALQVDGRPADVGIATTGVAGPDSPDGQPVGTVIVGVSTPEGVRIASFLFDGDRAAVRAQATDAALQTALDMVGE